MKKRFVSILLVAAMTASLAACGGSNGGDNSASATEKGGKTESASDGGEITLTIPTFFVGEMDQDSNDPGKTVLPDERFSG